MAVGSRARSVRPWIVAGLVGLGVLGFVFRRDLNALLPPPAFVAERAALPACGVEYATTQNGPWNSEARDCFWSAYLEGRPAEFISSRPTVEGAEVTTYYRVVARGNIEVITDSRLDHFASRDWTVIDCPFLRLLDGEPSPNFGPGEDCTVRQAD